MEQFRGIFRLTYAGDAFIVLKTKVQVCAICCPVPYVCVLPYSNRPAHAFLHNLRDENLGFAFPLRGRFHCFAGRVLAREFVRDLSALCKPRPILGYGRTSF
jgi:hypothetical protein